LRPIGADHGLGIVGLAVFMGVRAAHQCAVRIGEVALTLRRRLIVGRFGRVSPAASLGVVDGLLGFVGRAFGFCFGARLGLNPCTGFIEFCLEAFASGDFCWQSLRIAVLRVGRLGLRGQRGDVGCQLCPQGVGAIVTH